ncbi:hypothetical protein D3C73_1609490 [compost metagenome]
MSIRLEFHRLDNGFFQALGLSGVAAQDRLEIHGVLIAQAQQQTSLHGQPHPIAGAAKVVAVG